MTGVDRSLKGTEAELSVVSSSCYPTTSSNSDSPSLFISDECMPNPEDGRISTSSFPNNDWSMVTTTPRHGTTSDMFSHNFDTIYSTSTEKEMMSPSIQPMDYSAGYDPERIPSAIFSSNSAGQGDWSLASNESLFSIPNYSFSRNQPTLPQKSEELGLIGESNTNSTNPFLVFESKSIEANNFSPNLHPVIETDTELEREHSLDIKVNDKEITEEPSKQVEGITPKQTEHYQKHVQSLGGDVSTSVQSTSITGMERNRNDSSTTLVSAESQKSANSFAFPVYLNEVENSSSPMKQDSTTVKATSRNTEKRWFSFSCFRIWPKRWTCCP